MPPLRGPVQLAGPIGLTFVALLAVWVGGGFRTNAAPDSSGMSTTEVIEAEVATELHPVLIRQPAGPPRVNLGIKNTAGEPITAACSTCHHTRQPNFSNSVSDNLDEFHGGLQVAHGSLNCLACHNPGDYDSLRLADGSRLEFSDVMTLCSQCHGTQRRDYDHGVHGGMNGYWDLNRGPRTRNNCVDCHHPHAPQFPQMRRTFFPRDRFLETDHE